MTTKSKGLKLIIQINCYNEEQVLEQTINELPKKLDGIDNIELLIVDDGSSDKTIEIAKKLGVEHIVKHHGNKGLPTAVNSGIFYALRTDADIIVNTDADNQYKGEDIQRLINPIIYGKCDFVYGERQINKINHFSKIKKLLQILGAKVVSHVSGFEVTDAASGFRAINKHAMRSLYLLSDYASPLENLIQAKSKKLSIQKIPILINGITRESRIFKSKFTYVKRSAKVILNNLLIYKPTETFMNLAGVFLVIGLTAFISRFTLIVGFKSTQPHLTLLIIAISGLVISVQLFIFAMQASLTSTNRKLLEQVLYKQNYNLSIEKPVIEILNKVI
jgi:glycosyltransferase involved in cell wall biosynthesis